MFKIVKQNLILMFCLSVTACFFSSVAWAQQTSANFTITRSVIDAGGGRVKSANFALEDSIGQASAIGFSSAGAFSLDAGYQQREDITPPVIDSVTPLNPGYTNPVDGSIWYDQGATPSIAIQVQYDEAHADYASLDAGGLENPSDNINLPDGDDQTTVFNVNIDSADADGAYTITATVYDAAGNNSSWEIIVNLDNTAPGITDPVGDTSSTTGEDIVISATIEDPLSGIATAVLYYTPIDSVEAVLDFGSGSAMVPVADNKVGDIEYYVVVTDNVGNSSREPEIGFYVITVTDNDPPSADAGTNQTVNEGSVVSFDGSGSSDNIGITSWVWDFGDGTPNATGSATVTHTYADGGSPSTIYTVTLTVDDAAGNGPVPDTIEVTVNNVAPTVDAGPDQVGINEGTTVSFNGSFSDPGWPDTHTASWSFGDGTASEAGTVSEENIEPDATGTVTGSHAYGDDETYTVTLTVTDVDSGAGTDELEVTIENVAPTVTLSSLTGGEVVSGTAVSITWTTTDPGWLDTHTAHVYYNIDSGAWLELTPAAGVADPESYSWDTTAVSDSDRYKVRVRIVDDDGGEGEDSSGDFFTIDNNALIVTPATPDPQVINADFGETTTLPYTLSEPAYVTLSIYDIAVTWIKDIVTNDYQQGGVRSILWDGTDAAGNPVANGDYFYRITGTDTLGNPINPAVDGPAITIRNDKPVISNAQANPSSTGIGEGTLISYTLFTRDNPNQFRELDTQIVISDSVGTAVRTIPIPGSEFGSEAGEYYEHTWDGLDDLGGVVGAGVYEYTITAVRVANGGNPKAREANPKSGGILIFGTQYIESDDSNLGIYFEPDWATVIIEKNPDILQEAASALVETGSHLVSSIYQAYSDEDITSSAKLIFKYEPDLYGKALKIYAYNPDTMSWEILEKQVLDKPNNKIIAETTSLSLFTLLSHMDLTLPEGIDLEAAARIEPETLNVNPGILTTFISFPAGYNVADIIDATCDGAPFYQMELSEDEKEMIIKFKRTDIEKALAEQGKTIDTHFTIKGTFNDGTAPPDDPYIFQGENDIKEIIENSTTPKDNSGGKGKDKH